MKNVRTEMPDKVRARNDFIKKKKSKKLKTTANQKTPCYKSNHSNESRSEKKFKSNETTHPRAKCTKKSNTASKCSSPH